ncbi:MAG: zinc-dependent metalloprotease [Pseudomonadota bacterium]
MPSLKLFYLLAAVVLLSACGGDEPKGGEQIRQYTQGMSWQDGFLPLYLDERKGRVYLLLQSSELELLYQESLPRGIGSNDIGMDRGELGDRTALVRFEAAGERVLLKKLNLRYRADSQSEAERLAVEQAFASSVLWGFPVVARDGQQRLLDATDFLLRDSHGVARRLKAMEEGTYKVESSRSAIYPPRTRAFPNNTELEALITLVGENPGKEVRSVVPDPLAISVHMHHSFIELPDPGYRPRRFHPRSGFWSQEYADYAAPLGASLERRVIPRHRLIKANPGKGVSAPVEPLIYYLDPGIPEPVKGALLEGASWWNEAFDAAGFENAFRVEILPEGADPMDVRYNVIQWVHRSTRGWSYGASVVDPRTGEILKGHVTLGSLRVRQDLLIARGMTAPFLEAELLAEEVSSTTNPNAEDGATHDGVSELDDAAIAMALARIRQLSAHEVGHTLGLAHNFAASARERASVMDYPYPEIALNAPGGVKLGNAYATGIGAWDKRAIHYGYAQFEEASEDEALLEHIARNDALGFEFISDPDSRSIDDFHPRSHLWDNGAEPIAELQRLLDLRAHALNRFGAGVLTDDAPMSDLQEAIVPVYLYHRYQVEAVGKLLGGSDYAYVLKSDSVAEPVSSISRDRQRAALGALLKTLAPSVLVLPDSLLKHIPPKAYGYQRSRESAPARTGATFDPVSLAEAAAEQTLAVLLHPERLARIALQKARDENQLSLADVYSALKDSVLLPEHSGLAGAIDRRVGSSLLRRYRALMSDLAVAPEVRASARAALLDTQRLFRARHRSDEIYRRYYDFELWLIDHTMRGDGDLPESSPVRIPPGSPVGAAL